MAIEAGSVFVRLGAHLDRHEFDRFDKAIDKAQHDARTKKLQAELGGDFHPKAFNEFDRALDKASRNARIRKRFRAELGADYNAKGVNAYIRGLDRVEKEQRTASRGAEGHGRALRTVGRGAAYALGAGGFGGGLYAIFDVLKKSIGAYRESEKVTKDTAAVLKSTGHVAGLTAKEIADLSFQISSKSGVDDEQIQKGQNMLLTFKNVRNEVGRGNDVFSRASQIAVDMSARFDQGLKPSFIQLGKALDDPVKGLTALRRIGVSFTKDEQDQIKTLAEHGKTLEAQRLILKAVESQTRGSAAAQATSTEKLKVNLGNLAETIGRGLAPMLSRVTRSLNVFVRQMLDGTGRGGRFVQTLNGIWQAARPIVTWAGRAALNIGRFAAHHPTVTKLALAVTGVGIAVNAIRTSRAVSGIGTLLGALRRLARTKAGEAAADEIASGIGSVPRRSGRILDRVKGVWRRVLGSAGASAGDRAADAIVHNTGTGVDKRSGRFKGIGTRIGMWIGPAAAAAAIPLIDKAFNDWLAQATGTSGKAKTKGGGAAGGTPGGAGTTGGAHDFWDAAKRLFGGERGGLWTPGGFVRGFAGGGMASGTALVGEKGPELVNLPFGSRVHSNTTSKRMLKGIGEDLKGLTRTGDDAGKRTAKALEDRLTHGYRETRKVSKKINKEVGGDFEDLRKDSDRTFKRMSDKTGDRFEDIRRTGGRQAKRTRDVVVDRFSDMRHDAGRHLDRLRNAVLDRFGDAARAGKRQSERLRGSVGSSMTSLDRAVQAGMDYVGQAVNEALKSFGAKPVTLNVPKPRGLREGGVIPAMVSPGELIVDPSGNAARVPGQRVAADSVLTYLREGTAVLTGHGQTMMRQGASLEQALRDQLPHFREGGATSHWDRLVGAANKVDRAHFPYHWGGGHENPANFEPFDCSGAVSYIVQQAGYRVPTTVAGGMGSLGLPRGSGRATIFYNGGHTFMRIGDRYWGTSGFGHPEKGTGAAWFSRSPGAGYLGGFSTVHLPDLGKESVGVGGQVDIPKINVRGPTGGLRNIASGAIDRMRRAAGRYSERKFSEMPAGSGQALIDGTTGPIHGGRYVSTSYGPPWGGIQGGGTTATGIDLHGSPHRHLVAVDPSVIPLHSRLKIWPNPFGYRGAFAAEDTGGAIQGNRLDFYDWRGRSFQNAWGRRTVGVERARRGRRPKRRKHLSEQRTQPRHHHRHHHRRRRAGLVGTDWIDTLEGAFNLQAAYAELTPSTADDLDIQQRAYATWIDALRNPRFSRLLSGEDKIRVAGLAKSAQDEIASLTAPADTTTGPADDSADLQARLDQALRRADTLQETVRLSAAAFNVFGGPGDIGAGGRTALGAVANPFAYGGPGPGLGMQMDPVTGQVHFTGAAGPHGQAHHSWGSPMVPPPVGPGWHILKIDDPAGQRVVGNAAVGGVSQQGYRQSVRETVGI